LTPDLLCLGKGLTGGYLPVAATLATDEVYEAFLGPYSELKTFFHGHTYTGNPLGCAAALATLDLFESNRTLEKLEARIAQLSDGLTRFRDLPHVGDVRQCGLIAAVELVANGQSRRPYPWEERVGVRVCAEARREGVLVRPLGNTIVIMPPLVIGEGDLDRLLGVVYDAVRDVTEAGG
jgi:adenosylmethionine-8-amino-7-oxononanoate aminotransferase